MYGDGLILLNMSCDSDTYLLSNPRTRQETILKFPYSSDHSSKMYGVCSDSIHEDVKVVIAFMNFSTVYSCKNRSWAKKKEFPYKIVARRRFDGGLAVDGAIYWICHKKDTSSKIIVCFDSKDDSFRILQKSEYLADDQRIHLKARKSRLYLCCYGEREKTVKIWIKEKGGCSWKFFVDIDNLNNGTIGPTLVAPLTENEMIICLGWERYYIYNCCDKSYHEFAVNFNLTGFSLHPFVGSMFSPVMKRESGRKRKLSNA